MVLYSGGIIIGGFFASDSLEGGGGGGVFLGGLIFGEAYYRNFTVSSITLPDKCCHSFSVFI